MEKNLIPKRDIKEALSGSNTNAGGFDTGSNVQTATMFAEQIAKFGIAPKTIHRNLPVGALVDMAVSQSEGAVTSTGALSVRTGKYTGRSPDDRYIVYDDLTQDTVDWGKINHPFPEDKFDRLLAKMKGFVAGKSLFAFDGFVGADPKNRLAIRVINDRAWQSLFARQLFVRPSAGELRSHKPDFTIMCINDFGSIPKEDGTNSDVFIILNLSRGIVLIGGTSYAGEMKKSMFSTMNFVLPSRGVFPMHCSANMGRGGDTALFFGLSGTGKTTLSTDPDRMLIGDDEHGWSDRGIFNFEGGCYAKCIHLSREAEPEIWNAIRSGAVLENVVIDSRTLRPDFDDGKLTENTRVAYPLDHIPGAVTPSIGGNPKTIIFLTADAMGVLPPVSRLTEMGAMYHFMSGYTSKLAGTERGIKEPKATFSECFGAPFMPRHAAVYAGMLGEKIKRHGAKTYFINTGWSGGPYGAGSRIKIRHSRAMVTAALSGALDAVPYRHDDLFNIDVPIECPGVPADVLNPRMTWPDRDSYDQAAERLAQMFVRNFTKFGGVSPQVLASGPRPSQGV